MSLRFDSVDSSDVHGTAITYPVMENGFEPAYSRIYFTLCFCAYECMFLRFDSVNSSDEHGTAITYLVMDTILSQHTFIAYNSLYVSALRQCRQLRWARNVTHVSCNGKTVLSQHIHRIYFTLCFCASTVSTAPMSTERQSHIL